MHAGRTGSCWDVDRQKDRQKIVELLGKWKYFYHHFKASLKCSTSPLSEDISISSSRFPIIGTELRLLVKSRPLLDTRLGSSQSRLPSEYLKPCKVCYRRSGERGLSYPRRPQVVTNGTVPHTEREDLKLSISESRKLPADWMVNNSAGWAGGRWAGWYLWLRSSHQVKTFKPKEKIKFESAPWVRPAPTSSPVRCCWQLAASRGCLPRSWSRALSFFRSARSPQRIHLSVREEELFLLRVLRNDYWHF